MESDINEIKKRIDIVEFIGSFIQIKKTGRNFKAVCPFHQEKTPSFVISPDRQIWRCFGGCQIGGDAISFLMKWENITFSEALKELADKVGVKLKTSDFEDRIWKKKEKLIHLNSLASQYYQYVLHKTKFGEKALNYLQNRKINTKIIQKFNLGYALNSWDGLLNFLKKKDYTQEEIFEAGLIVKSERGTYYDRFRGRLVFPIKDSRGSVIGFSGRVLDKETKEAKYINSPESPIYRKRETLYGIDLAKEGIKKEKSAILVEGEFDVISPYQIGVENIVAIKGSALTREQLMLLKRYTQKIILSLDADATGEEAMKRGIEEAERLDFEIYVVSFNFAKDPDEAIQKDPIKFKDSLKKNIPLYDFLFDIAIKNNPGNDPFSKKRIAMDIVPSIEKIKNPIIKSHYVKKLTNILEVDEESINFLIKKQTQNIKQTNRFKLKQDNQFSENRELMVQKYLLSILFQDQDMLGLAEKIFAIVQPEDFSILSYQKIIKLFLQYKSEIKEFSLDNFIKNLPKELQPVFDEIYLSASIESDFKENNIEKLAYEIKKSSLKKTITSVLADKTQDPLDQTKKISDYSHALKEVEKILLTL